MADSSPRGSCSLDRLAQLFQDILTMHSQKSICSRMSVGRANGRGCIICPCSDALQCSCSGQCRPPAPTKRRSDVGHLLDDCFAATKRSKRAKVETIQSKKEFKESSKELESLRIGTELVSECLGLGPERNRFGAVDGLRADVIFVLEDSETDGTIRDCQSHRFVLVSSDIYFS